MAMIFIAQFPFCRVASASAFPPSTRATQLQRYVEHPRITHPLNHGERFMRVYLDADPLKLLPPESQ